ncbi:MAG: hypothetical protein PHN56_00390 [Candidatus Nanoarchaeia archaeon]|nr:hypothetical protein [Candidatus Nanoarchaeia archaeon]
MNLPNYLTYKNNEIYIKNINYKKLLSFGTPVDIIILDRIKDNINVLKNIIKKEKSNLKIYYCLKACYLKKILQTIKTYGDGVAVGSNLELFISKNSNFSNDKIIFNGVGRTKEILMKVLYNKIRLILSSETEFNNILDSKFKKINVGLRISSKYLGKNLKINAKYSNIGLSLTEAEKIIIKTKNTNININGFSFHIFSNKTNLNDYYFAINKLNNFIKQMIKKYNLKIEYVDFGGGFAPRILFNSEKKLEDNFTKFVHLLNNLFDKNIELILELGRYIVSDSSMILSKIVTENNSWKFINIGTNYLIPALGYNFFIVPCEKNMKNLHKNIISDTMGTIISKYTGNKLHEKDNILVLNTGAYTNVMKEQFLFKDPIKIYIENNKIIKIKKGITEGEILKYHG